MSYVRVNGVLADQGAIDIPRIGLWRADLRVLAQEPLRGRAEIAIAGAGALRGTVYQASLYRDSVPMRVVGGAGGLGRLIGPRYYDRVNVNAVLGDICKASGERLSPLVAPAILSRRLDRWMMPATNCAAALTRLLEVLGIEAWRILADGTLWLGGETWPASKVEYELVAEDPERALADLFIPAGPLLGPGVTLEGRKVSRVRWVWGSERVRTFVWFEA